jgi:hypothetical protein
MNTLFKNNGIIYFVILLISSSLLIGCSLGNKEKVIMEKTLTFKNNNWDFPHQIITFTEEIPETSAPCKIVLEMNHEAGLEPTTLPVTVTITSPEESETSKRAVFNFFENVNDSITSCIAYKEKYFNRGGKYKFRLYRKYSKYDLYGVKSITVKVIQIPKKNEKTK